MTQPPDEYYNQARQRAAALLHGILTPDVPVVDWIPLDELAQRDQHTFVRLRCAQAIWEADPQVALGEMLLGILRGLDGGAGCWHCWLMLHDAEREEIDLNLGAPYPDLARRLSRMLPYLQIEPADNASLHGAARHASQRIIVGVLGNRSTEQRRIQPSSAYAQHFTLLMQVCGDSNATTPIGRSSRRPLWSRCACRACSQTTHGCRRFARR